MATQHNFRIKNGLEVAGTVRINSAGLITGTTTTQSASDNTTKLASTAYVTTALANLADSAPSTLNTLNELANALGDNENFATDVTASIAAKLPLAGGTMTGALTTNGIINTGTSHNFAINTPNSLRINIDSNDSATDQVFVIGHNQTSVDTNNALMTIKESGNVGIGITPKAYHSDYKAIDINNSASVMGYTGNNGAWLMENLYYDGNWKHKNSDFSALVEMYDGVFNLYNTASGTAGATATLQNRLKIDSSGAVGIGCTPDAWSGYSVLQIGNGGALSANDDVTFLSANAYSSASGWKYITTDEASVYHQEAGKHIWYGAASGSADAAVSWSEAMRIDGDGNVGIGTSTPGNNHAKANNLVVGSGSAGGMAVYNGTAEGWYAFSRDNANNTDAYDGGMSYTDRNLRFHTNAGATRLKIDGGGDTEIYGHLSFEDNKLLMFGGGQDARLYFDASTNALYITASNGTANTVNITTNNFQIGGATPLISGTANDSVVINQDGASNIDFRVESDNEQYNFFCDASSEIIHFGEGTNSDVQSVIPAGTLAGKRHQYHGGNKQHAGQTFKYSESTGWTDAIKIDWHNVSWGAVCLRITGMYYYNASDNFSIVIGFQGYGEVGSSTYGHNAVSYDATSSGAMNWTTAIQLAQTAVGETMIRQRAGDTTGDIIYRYEWQCYARSNQPILIIEQ